MFCWLILLFFSACATLPYQHGQSIEGPDTLRLTAAEAQIERGRPVPLLDGAGHYVLSLPSKLILWNWSVDNHDISSQTEAALRTYLADNDLHEVKIRLNQYAPGAEWSRLVRNRAVGGFWRYTLGVVTTSLYTILPGRLFGGDHYNPFTNTIHLYSDHPSIALHEAAHAKDFAQREWKGAYAMVRMLPLVPLYQEGIASSDVFSYARSRQDLPAEQSASKILYPAYSTYVTGEALTIWSWFGGPLSYWSTLAIQGAVAIPAHVAGRLRAAMIEDEYPLPTGN